VRETVLERIEARVFAIDEVAEDLQRVAALFSIARLRLLGGRGIVADAGGVKRSVAMDCEKSG